MADHELNVHVKAKGADETERDLEKINRRLAALGREEDNLAEHSKKAADSTEKLREKQTGLSSVLSGLRSRVIGFIGAWAGIEGIQKLLDMFIQKLERMSAAMKEIHTRSLQLLEVGQQLEFQTGTSGRQSDWAEKALGIQKAGVRDAATAGALMIATDVNLAGGIMDAKNMQLLQQTIAPFVGTAGLSAEEASKLMEFSQTAGIEQTPEAWMQYLSQLQAGFTASKATNFGLFMTGLQKGATPYMAAGGSLTEAISLFSGARSVTANEALAGTLLEQVTRISGGAYEKPRQAMEAFSGQRWGDISTDQRAQVLLQYAQSLPDNQRAQFLAEAGFPPELINQINRLVTPGGMSAISSTRQRVTGASPETLQRQMDSFAASPVAKRRVTEAVKSEQDLKAGPGYADWQNLIDQQRAIHERFVAAGDDLPISDDVEPIYMAAESMLRQLEQMGPAPTQAMEARRQSLIRSLGRWTSQMRAGTTMLLPDAAIEAGVRGAHGRFGEFLSDYNLPAPDPTSAGYQYPSTIINNNNVIYNAPDRSASPRSAPEDLN